MALLTPIQIFTTQQKQITVSCYQQQRALREVLLKHHAQITMVTETFRPSTRRVSYKPIDERVSNNKSVIVKNRTSPFSTFAPF